VLLDRVSTSKEAANLLIGRKELTDGFIYERLYGSNGGSSRTGILNGRVSYVGGCGKVTVPFDDSVKGSWIEVLDIQSPGYLSNLHGILKECKFRITIDSIKELIVDTTSFRYAGIMWGDHMTGRSIKNPGGFYFHKGFQTGSLQYLLNFMKGAVRFEESLKIEVLVEKTLFYTRYLDVDYLLDVEIQ
jgi:hypothetical protein